MTDLPQVSQPVSGRAGTSGHAPNHCTLLLLIGGRAHFRKMQKIYTWLRESKKNPSRILYAENNNKVIIINTSECKPLS